MFFLQCTGPLGSVVEKLEGNQPHSDSENRSIQGCPFGALGNLHDTEVAALTAAAEPGDLAIAWALRNEDDWFRKRLIECAGGAIRDSLGKAMAAASGASQEAVTAAQIRVVTAAQGVLALEGVALPELFGLRRDPGATEDVGDYVCAA